MGKRPLPDDVRRSRTITIRLTDDDREAIEKAARAKGQTASSWAADALRRAASRANRSG